MQPAGKLVIWLVVLAAIIGSLIIFQNYYVDQSTYSSEEVTKLTSLQEKQFELFLEMNHLLVTLATLTLAGIGAFVFNRYKTGIVPSGQTARAIVSWIFAGLSLFAGYLADEKVAWMLKYKFFDLSNPQILWVTRAQFWLFIVSLLSLGLFFYFGLHERIPAETPAPPGQAGTGGVTP